MVQLLIDYANKNNIILNYPRLLSCNKCNTEIVQLLIDFTDKIILF